MDIEYHKWISEVLFFRELILQDRFQEIFWMLQPLQSLPASKEDGQDQVAIILANTKVQGALFPI